jgi:hypothetical protein
MTKQRTIFRIGSRHRNIYNTSNNKQKDNDDNNKININNNNTINNNKKLKQLQRQLKYLRKDETISDLMLYQVHLDAMTMAVVVQHDFLYKVFQRERRTFQSIKLFSCTTEDHDDTENDGLHRVIETLLNYNSTETLVLSYNVAPPLPPPQETSTTTDTATDVDCNNNNNHHHHQSLEENQRHLQHKSQRSALKAIQEGLRTNQSVKVLKLLGLDFSSSATTITTTMSSVEDEASRLDAAASAAATSFSSSSDIQQDHSDKSGSTLVDFSWLSRNGTLQELHLTGSRQLSNSSSSSSYSIRSLCQALSANRGLRVLHLDDCQLSDSDMAAILRALQHHATLETLDLSHNAAHVQTLNALTMFLLTNKSVLTTLRLRSQQPLLLPPPQPWQEPGPDDNAVISVTSSLLKAIQALTTHNSTLKCLDLSGNDFSLHDVTVENSSPSSSSSSILEALSLCCRVHPTLQVLDLSDCNLSTLGICTLSRHLPFFPRLDVLNLTGNPISMVPASLAAMALLHGLHGNYILSSLGESPLLGAKEEEESSGCCQQREQQQPAEWRLWSSQVQYYLDLNRSGRRALQQQALSPHHHPLSRSLWAHILARAASSSSQSWCHDKEDENNKDVDPDRIHSRAAVARRASILFALLQGPALLER